MEQALDFNLVLGIVFGLLGVFLLILWIAVPFLVFSIRKRLDDTNRHLKEILARRPEEILAKRLQEIQVELRALAKATQIQEKTTNRRHSHRVTQLYRTPTREEPER